MPFRVRVATPAPLTFPVQTPPVRLGCRHGRGANDIPPAAEWAMLNHGDAANTTTDVSGAQAAEEQESLLWR